MRGMAASDYLSIKAACPSSPYCMGWSIPFDNNKYLQGQVVEPDVRYDPIKESSGSISSIDSLCAALDITSRELSEALALSVEERYQRKETAKKDGSTRVVYNPHFLIRKIQRRINKRIFSNPTVISWPNHIFGSIPNDPEENSPASNKDYINCVRQHCGAKSVLTLDIKDFFDNIHREQVTSIFLKFLMYPKIVSETLADICCRDQSVAQGALTSSYIATLCLFKEEGNLVKRLAYKSLIYTRFVDDITISSRIANYDFSYALKQTEQMLCDAGLPINTQKTHTQYVSMQPIIVHGLRVDFQQPRLPPEEPRKIRAAVKSLELLAGSPGYRASHSYRKDFNRCMGRVNKLGRIGHSQHAVLLKRLRGILPLPSHMDISRAERLIDKLQESFSKPDYAETHWFRKRYYVANERLVILKRSFPLKEKELRAQLKKIAPPQKND
jgi:RNA-directed DNA polymerase